MSPPVREPALKPASLKRSSKDFSGFFTGFATEEFGLAFVIGDFGFEYLGDILDIIYQTSFRINNLHDKPTITLPVGHILYAVLTQQGVNGSQIAGGEKLIQCVRAVFVMQEQGGGFLRAV